jgi:hypothetical protein
MNSKQILDKLPDYNDLMSLTEEIASTSSKKLYLENKIKAMESEVVLRVTKEPEFFQGGKPPSMSFIESTYKFTGINQEILPLREQLAEVISKLDSLKIKMDVFKQLIEIWRTLSANERSSGLQ